MTLSAPELSQFYVLPFTSVPRCNTGNRLHTEGFLLPLSVVLSLLNLGLGPFRGFNFHRDEVRVLVIGGGRV